MQQQNIKLVVFIFTLAFINVLAQDNTTTPEANNTTITNTTTDCGENQILQESGFDCLTCQNPNGHCSIKSEKKCYCISMDYVLTSDNRCILLSNCTDQEKCGINEVYASRGNNQISCHNYKTMDLIKKEDCYCKNGYVRNKDQKCVQISECPKQASNECPVNQTYSENGGYDCLTCKIQTANCPLRQTKGCYCMPGYVRESEECILPKDCQNVLGMDPACLDPESIQCPKRCVKSCNSFWIFPQRFCSIACMKRLNSCCPGNLVLDTVNKRCISKRDCSRDYFDTNPYQFRFY